MSAELEPGTRVETTFGPGTVVADDRERELRLRGSDLRVCVELDRPGSRVSSRLFFEPADVQAVLV